MSDLNENIGTCIKNYPNDTEKPDELSSMNRICEIYVDNYIKNMLENADKPQNRKLLALSHPIFSDFLDVQILGSAYSTFCTNKESEDLLYKIQDRLRDVTREQKLRPKSVVAKHMEQIMEVNKFRKQLYSLQKILAMDLALITRATSDEQIARSKLNCVDRTVENLYTQDEYADIHSQFRGEDKSSDNLFITDDIEEVISKIHDKTKRALTIRLIETEPSLEDVMTANDELDIKIREKEVKLARIEKLKETDSWKRYVKLKKQHDRLENLLRSHYADKGMNYDLIKSDDSVNGSDVLVNDSVPSMNFASMEDFNLPLSSDDSFS